MCHRNLIRCSCEDTRLDTADPFELCDKAQGNPVPRQCLKVRSRIEHVKGSWCSACMFKKGYNVHGQYISGKGEGGKDDVPQ